MKNSIILVIVLISVILSACNLNGNEPYQMKSFTFTNQHGQDFGVEDLNGKVWIADFIFTSCETVCPPMTANMAALQKTLKSEDIPVEFVSFSVDPSVDTPEKLREFMKKFTEDDSNWNMLTGYTQPEIEKFAREEFQTLIQKPESSNQVIHGTNFYLINQNGEIVNDYSFTLGDDFKEIITDVKKQTK
ncbi:SCO family protein [Domibacillus mangrovi]|uniref:SCO family protein n=1 Tax=Domibacillus mangrovi TaxID=1714354 RepID=UPI0009FA586A|nr:SCO family protein [Domibacillus mangrovi]